MFAPLATKRPERRQISSFTEKTSPIGGWNARDSLALMKDTDATFMDNWYCLPSEVRVRLGSAYHVTGIGSQVESLMVWQSGASQKMFAAAGTAFYDASSAGAVGASVQSGLSNARWQSVNYQLAGTTWLIAVNGADKPRYTSDGTTWVAVDGASVPAITGVTTTLLSNVTVHQRRLWFVERATMKCWYLPVDAVGGAATMFDFGPLFHRGGFITAISTWTIDAGQGSDDKLVVMTSKGQVAVYAGTDPASSSTWALIGIYDIGEPLGPAGTAFGARALTKYAGDLLIITKDGLVPCSKALQSNRVSTRIAFTDKIQAAISQATSDYATSFGWQCILYPPENMLLLNVPVGTGAQEQYVMNTISGAWSRFTGWGANCWVLFNDELYFGGNGIVYQAWTGHTDQAGASTFNNIEAECQQAFSDFGSPGVEKQWRMIRPTLRVDNSVAVSVAMNTGYNSDAVTSLLSVAASTASVFDTALFDASVFASDELYVVRPWQDVEGVSDVGGTRIKVATNAADVRWVSTNHVYERGAGI